MAAVVSPPSDPQSQENGALQPPQPAPVQDASPSIIEDNNTAVQQNSLAEAEPEPEPMAIDGLDTPVPNPKVPASEPSAPQVEEKVPEISTVNNFAVPPPTAPEAHVAPEDAETAGSAPVADIESGDPSLPNGESSHVTGPVSNGITQTAPENGQVESDKPSVDESSIAAPDNLPTETLNAELTTTVQDQPIVDTELPSSAAEPASVNDAPIIEDVPASTKVAREREEDNDAEEPASKRTKTDEDVQTEPPPAQANASVAPATANEQTQEAASAPAPDSSAVAPQSYTQQDWGEMTEVQLKRLLEGMRNLKKGKHASLFSKPVDPVALNLPTYRDIVKEPMDLSTMETKLKNREYPSVADYVADFDLMVNNAIKFNGQQHPVAQSGMMIRSQFEAQLRRLPKPGEPVPEPPPKTKRASLPGPPREPPRREPRQSLGHATSPATSFAPDANGVPLARRDSNVADRPKRKIQKPQPREIQYSRPQKKKYKTELVFAAEVLTELERPRYKDVCSAPFLTPVDPVALGIPNYNQVIKKPMDVSTIRHKLNEQQYENLKEFEADFRLMFKNCYKFNPEGHAVNALGHQYESLFDEQMAKKHDRLKALAPPSTRDSPDDDDDDEEDDEESEDENTDQQKQLAALNEQLKLLSEQAAKLMSKPAKSKDKKGKGSKAEGKKKKSSGAGLPPSKKEKPKHKSKPKAKPLTQKDKEEISNRIFELPTDEIEVIAAKIKSAMRARGEHVTDETEMEFNIDDIPEEILHDILRKLRQIDNRLKGVAANKDEDDDYDARPDPSGSYAPKSKRNKPMSRTDTQNQMAAIQQQINSFNGRAGSPQGMMQSSSDEDSGSESEEE